MKLEEDEVQVLESINLGMSVFSHYKLYHNYNDMYDVFDILNLLLDMRVVCVYSPQKNYLLKPKMDEK